VIKPNVLRSSKAEEHIVTNPALLRAVIEKVEELSPLEIIVGDNPGLVNYGENENSFEKTGLMAAAKGYYRNIGDTMQNLAYVKPKANPELCTACGACIEHCPVSALTMKETTVPVVDADTCIACFCCQEICPEQAMSLN
jgi:ferredoxin